MSLPQLLESLYGHSKWKPILAFETPGGFHWLPKSQSGSFVPNSAAIKKLGVWGGTVETYEIGFNQQPCELVFAGIDVDWGKQIWNINPAGGIPSELCGPLPDNCAKIIPEALVRRSTSGLGAHLFLRLAKPIRCNNKLEAQRLACEIARPVARRLEEHQIKPDIVGHNQLWVWGGHQETTNDPNYWIDPQIEAPKQLKVAPAVTEGEEALFFNSLGPTTQKIIQKLHDHNLVRIPPSGVLGTTYHLHIAAMRAALEGILPSVDWPHSAGTRLHEHNCVLNLSEGMLKLFSFVEHRTVISLPLGV